MPVPVHRSKERQRGFNQAAYLAEKLGHYTGISTDVNIVQKVLKTKSQKKLNALQRRKNLEKAFCVTGDVRGKNILVIDDVYTTGSTIDLRVTIIYPDGNWQPKSVCGIGASA